MSNSKMAPTVSETASIRGDPGNKMRLPDGLQPQKSLFEILTSQHNSLKIMNKIFLTPFRGYICVDRLHSSCHDEYTD